MKTVSVSGKSYNIKSLDSHIRFGVLAAGSYDFKIIATNAAGKSTSFTKSFTVNSVNNKAANPLGYKWGTRDVTSTYGRRKHPIYGTIGNHDGMDIAAAKGTAVYSSLDGEVIYSTYGSKTGNIITVKSGKYYIS